MSKNKSDYVSQMKMTQSSDLFTETDTEKEQSVLFLNQVHNTAFRDIFQRASGLPVLNLAFMAKDDLILNSKVKSNERSLPWHVCEPSQPLPDLLRKGNLKAHEKFTQGFAM